MAISIRFNHPYIEKIPFQCLWKRGTYKDGMEYIFNNIFSFKVAFNECIQTDYHLYRKGEGYLLRVLDNNGYFYYESRIYILGDEKEKEECIEFIKERALLKKVFE